MAESGNIVWPSVNEPLWRLNWSLANSPDEEGIVISQAFYRGHQAFYKASLPSLRVQYDGNCGPYKDPLNYDNAQTTTRCPTRKVCVYSYTSNGFRGLSIESYHRIAFYRLTHRWVFWEDGYVYPRLYSAGLQCNHNHRHHAYWRFDFDINGANNDLVLEYNTTSGNQGWGNGWHPKTFESTRRKNRPTQRSWAVLDKQSGHGYHILPGPHDGNADAFSTSDLWIQQYHGAEDGDGRQGNASNDELEKYLNGEDVDGRDVVIWYCGHLSHVAAHGGDEWHYVGPDLVPFHWP